MKYFFELKRDDGGTTKSLMINPVKQHKVNEASRKVNSWLNVLMWWSQCKRTTQEEHAVIKQPNNYSNLIWLLLLLHHFSPAIKKSKLWTFKPFVRCKNLHIFITSLKQVFAPVFEAYLSRPVNSNPISYKCTHLVTDNRWVFGHRAVLASTPSQGAAWTVRAPPQLHLTTLMTARLNQRHVRPVCKLTEPHSVFKDIW